MRYINGETWLNLVILKLTNKNSVARQRPNDFSLENSKEIGLGDIITIREIH
jgi:hypothetical protein